MRIALVGPGRAGTAIALAARRAGHRVVAVAARSAVAAVRSAEMVGGDAVAIGDPLPASDLVIVAVPDGVIHLVAGLVAPTVPDGTSVVHLSGAVPVAALEPIAERGNQIGSFHPLQTLPTPETGARRLAGAWIAVTADEPLRSYLGDFARSLAATPFDLDDDVRVLYHAAAAAASNFPVAALAVAEELFGRAGVPFHASRPLAEAAVGNAFELGPYSALTGPIVRGDVETVELQQAEVEEQAAEWVREAFGHLVAATRAAAARTGVDLE
jgi:predicted short-subunit dehydrogenase-like oxidoreductase (DUF2520 family)